MVTTDMPPVPIIAKVNDRGLDLPNFNIKYSALVIRTDR